jgi:hypothetical protein
MNTPLKSPKTRFSRKNPISEHVKMLFQGLSTSMEKNEMIYVASTDILVSFYNYGLG